MESLAHVLFIFIVNAWPRIRLPRFAPIPTPQKILCEASCGARCLIKRGKITEYSCNNSGKCDCGAGITIQIGKRR